MKLFQQLLVAPAALGFWLHWLLTPPSLPTLLS